MRAAIIAIVVDVDLDTAEHACDSLLDHFAWNPDIAHVGTVNVENDEVGAEDLIAGFLPVLATILDEHALDPKDLAAAKQMLKEFIDGKH